MQWEISGFHPGIASHSYLSVTQHELQANSSVYTEGKWLIVHYVASVISDPNKNLLWVWHQEWQQRTDSERAPVPKPRPLPQQLSFSETSLAPHLWQQQENAKSPSRKCFLKMEIPLHYQILQRVCVTRRRRDKLPFNHSPWSVSWWAEPLPKSWLKTIFSHWNQYYLLEK